MNKKLFYGILLVVLIIIVGISLFILNNRGHEHEYQSSFKMAILYVVEEDSNVQEDIQKLESDKQIFKNMFNHAGRELVHFDFSYPVAKLEVTNQNKDRLLILEKDGKYTLNLQEVSKEFYNNHPDNFNFLFIFNSFDLSVHGSALFYLQVQNKIEGIGLLIFDNSKQYGSNGKLLGMTNLGRFESTDVVSAYSRGKLMLHEISHQWGVYIGDRKNEGDLVLKDFHGVHWERGLNVGYDPLASSNSLFKDNGDGTFTVLPPSEYWFFGDERNEPVPKQTYSDLTLYLIGALQPEDIKSILWLDIPDAQSVAPNTIIRPEATRLITIQNIIDRRGERRYSQEN